MDAAEALSKFVKGALFPKRAERYNALIKSKKGQKKLLDNLCHDFECRVKPQAIKSKSYDSFWSLPCYLFYYRNNFGTPFSTLRKAYESVASDDSWLIVLQDGSAGIHRPEARWDAEILIVI